MGAKQSATTQFRGIVVGGNPVDFDDGAMHIASQNLVLREANTLEVRRGLGRLWRALSYDRIIAFEEKLLLHATPSNTMRRVGAPYFPAPSSADNIGTASHPSGRKIRHAVAGGRLFITSGEGIQVLDQSTGSLRPAGGPIAPGIDFLTNGAMLNGAVDWLADGYCCAYRYTLGRVTATGTQIIGPPSGRTLVSNTTASAGYPVDIALTIPPGLDDTHFVQIWRSSQVPVGAEPEDDLRLVYERALTQTECSTGYFFHTDVVPDALRGEYLYTSPNAGEGIQNANNPPPLGEDVVLHKDRLWVAVPTNRQSFSFRLLAVGGTNGLAANDRIVITGFSSPLTITAGTDFQVYTAGSASQNVADTAISIVSAINLQLFAITGTNDDLWAEYASGPDDVPGEIRLYGQRVTTVAFAVWAEQASGGAAWTPRTAFAPELLPILAGAAGSRTFSLQRVANVVTATISSGNLTDGLKVGDRVIIPNPLSASFGAGPHTVVTVGATTFTYAEVGINAGPVAGNVVNFYSDAIAASSSESPINRIYYSKPLEFEAFPEGNFVDVGSSSSRIVALAVTRETLWVFKEDGLYRITGDDPDTFDLERTDATVQAVAPDCVVSFAEAVVAWTTRGVVRITESSFEIISEDIDVLLRDYLQLAVDGSSLITGRIDEAFMLPDEREGLIRLFLPGSATDDNGSQLGCGECLVFSIVTKTWARWVYPRSKGNGYSKCFTHAVINDADRRAYFVEPYFNSTGEGMLWSEKVSGSATSIKDEDHAGDSFSITTRALFVAQYDKAPFLDKRWDEVVLLMRKPPIVGGMPLAFKYGFASPLSDETLTETVFGVITVRRFSAEQYTSETPVLPTARVMVPTDFSRGQYLWIGVQFDAEATEFALHGFAKVGEVLNTAISR